MNGKTTSFSKIKHSNSSHNTNLLLGATNTQSRHGSNNALATLTPGGVATTATPLTSTPGNSNSVIKTWRSDTHLNMYEDHDEVNVEEEEDEIDRILQANRQLEFSDHAGLYDILNSQTNNRDLDVGDGDEQQMSGDREYNLSKINYRLTYGEQMAAVASKRHDIFNLNPANEDSLIFNTSFNGLLLQQSDYHPQQDEVDHEVRQKKSYEEYYSNSSQYMDENSLMDWSMKLSQFEPNSPIKKRPSAKSRQADPSATTSWGKLKHSKSSSSNLGRDMAAGGVNNQHVDRPVNNNNLKLPSASSASLLKCFQNSKVINSSSNNSSATSTSSSEKEKTKTTCFSQLRQRSMSSIGNTQPSVGYESAVQPVSNKQPYYNTMETSLSSSRQRPNKIASQSSIHPPYNQTIICMVVDKSQKSMLNSRDIQLLAAKLATALNQQQQQQKQRMISKKTSLPDLAFLNNYSDNSKSLIQASSSSSQVATNIPVSLSSPISNFVKQSSPISEESENNCSGNEAASKSPVVGSDALKRKTLKSIKRYRQTKQNTEPCVPYALSDNSIHTTPQQQQQRVFSQDTTNNDKKPLKSCLKRKDTGSMADHSVPVTSTSNIKKCTRIEDNNSSSIYRLPPMLSISALMFLPGVGYLFTCDLESTCRYCYYNNLERRRRVRAYKELINRYDETDEDDEMDDEDPTATTSCGTRTDERQYVLRTHNSENDLGVRNVLDFLITERVVNNQDKSSTLTTNTNSNSSSYSNHNEEKKSAPPLQYNALIAMLKSAKSKPPPSQAPINQHLSTQINKKITFMLNDQDLMSSVINKRYQQPATIDSDQISLGSLSESPPSEFKFSEDEDEENEMNESYHVNTQKTVDPHKPPLSAQKIAEIKKMKKDFHRVLLKDSRLNSLKEILLELKQIQQKLTETESNSPTMSDSSNYKELKEGVEKLSQCLFEFMKTNMKPIDSNQSTSMLKSMANESPLLRQKNLTDSATLSSTFSQYLQLWNLVEFTINLNIVQSERRGSTDSNEANKSFHLSKDVYVNLFQEINKYEHTINQTYLIDNSSTSLLRRKHYFMVVLMSLKFKFHLFVVNLLNYRQLANWFDYLNKNKDLLNNFYDLRHQSSLSLNKNNSSGDSGVGGEFMNASILSSTSSLTLNHAIKPPTSSVVNSLANVSVFENDEYFHYFLKLLEQFDFVSLNARHFIDMKISSQQARKKPNFNNQTLSTDQTFKSQQVAESQMNYLLENHLKTSNSSEPASRIKSSYNISGSSNSTSSSTTSNTTPNGFNLKNISKKLNIKSWFGSSGSGASTPQNVTKNKISTAATTSNIAGYMRETGVAPKTSRTMNTLSRRGIMVHDDNDSLMKHSMSESNLNHALK